MKNKVGPLGIKELEGLWIKASFELDFNNNHRRKKEFNFNFCYGYNIFTIGIGSVVFHINGLRDLFF